MIITTMSAPERISKLCAALADRKMPIVRYVSFAALVTCIPVGLLNALADVLGFVEPRIENLVYSWPIPNHPRLGFVIGLADLVVFSPLVESAMLLVPIWFLRKLRVSDSTIPILSGLLWAFLHTKGQAWIQLVQIWPFYCFTVIFMAHEHPSVDRAWLRVSAVHAVHNVFGFFIGLSLGHIA